MDYLEVTDSTRSNLASIPSNYSRLIARTLGLRMQDLPKLLKKTELTTQQFLQENTRLTAQQQISILHNALALSDDVAFGLKVGQKLTPLTHGSLGFLVNSSSNLLMAFKAIQTFSSIILNFSNVKLVENNGWLECYYSINIDVDEEIHRSLSEASMMTFLSFGEYILGRELSEAQISFAHAEPNYSQLYLEFMPCQFEFSAPQVMLKLPMSVCLIPNVSANNENYLLALRQCEMMLSQLRSKKGSWEHQIQKLILSRPPGVLCEDEAAAALFISKRTLARKLKQENTGFRQVREKILSQQAAGYLRDSHISIDSIAALLNYHDSANFRRAFKRWFQMTPNQFRQNHKVE